MHRIKELVREIHRRSVWQVLGVYVAGAWGVLQVIEMFVDVVGLPPWILPFAIVLLLIGLPVVIATAFLQEGVPHPERDADAEPAPARRTGRGTGAASGTARISDVERLFTWRNAIAGGILAFALWGVIAAGWLMFAGPSTASRPFAPGPSNALAVGQDAAGEGDEPAEAEPSAIDSAPESPRDPARTGLAGPSDAGRVVEEADDAAPDAAGRVAGPEEGPRRARAVEGAAAPDPGRPAYQALRGRVERTRAAAETLAARETDPGGMARADSLWSAALVAAGRGGFTRAAADLERADALYERARFGARGAWERRVDSARSEVEARRETLGDAADSAPGVDTLLAAATRHEADGEFRSALSALGRAADALEEAGRAPAPAEAPDATPAAPTPRQRVEGVFAALERAFEAEDREGLRAVWTSLTSDQLENFARFFEDRREIDVTIEPQWSTLVAREGRVTISARIVWDYYDESSRRRERPPAFEQRFEIGERDGRWVILGS